MFVKMRLTSILVQLLILFECECANSTEQCPNAKKSLGDIRKRRHLTFSDGSDVVLTVALLKGFLSHVPSGWNIGMEFDVLFPLPDSKFTIAHSRRKLHHKQKREFWRRLQNAINLHNLNGHACVLRSICDAKSFLAPPGKSLVHDLLRAVFTAQVDDPDFTDEVANTFSELLNPNFCEETIDCPLSLVHFILNMNKQK